MFAFFFLLALSRAQADPEMIPLEVFQPPSLEAPAPDVALQLRDGGEFRMTDHRGEPVLLTFWASWCSPCRRELPALAAFANENPGLIIVAVNVDRTRSDAEGFLARTKFELPVAFDPDARILGSHGVTSMPTMLLYDGKGSLTWQHSGYSETTGFEELVTALRGVR